MNITIYGAVGEVTGSCYLLEVGNSRVLVDCGMFQGHDEVEFLNKIPDNLMAKPIDAVVVTHAHLDHTGRLPLLVKNGYHGPIFATQGTIEMAQLILNDAAKIQEQDAQRANRIHYQAGHNEVEPLYTSQDVAHACQQMKALDYLKEYEIAKGIKISFVEAGHILGSASIQMSIEEGGMPVKHFVFSGDIGPYGAPILKDPAEIDQADVVFMESTYGDRDHLLWNDTIDEFKNLIKDAVNRKGKILVPTFAIGRAQLILYELIQMFRNGDVKPFPIYLDSPMAIAATELYMKHQELMDEEALALEKSGQLEYDFSKVVKCETPDESRALNDIQGPCMILAGAGMCNAGRILHHLKHNLPSPNTLVLIVGYQASGSLGRILLEGATRVKIFGEEIVVRGKVKGLGGFSAHAGQTDLLRWLRPMISSKPRIILVHGEDIARQKLASKIQELYGISAELPKMEDVLNF